ncbi:MAG TPA: hypothetical protein VFX86_04325, partial [Candidatus Saccharimonadales bacterium]|nr:hypothetical protein [Candidatus Saccharimonadales bacterium]
MAYTPDQPVFERHLECFDAYLAHTDEKIVTLNAVVEGIRERAPNVWAHMQDSSRLFTALYVGVGSGGGLEIPLTGKIIDMRGGVSGLQVHCVDASTQMRDQFMDRLSAPHGQDLSQPVTPELITEYECRRFEEEGYRPPAADLALASHSWYFIPEWKDQPPATNTLKKFADTV